MRVKVGNQWFSAKRGQPIAVELTDSDKQNIANMLPHCTRYALFDRKDDDVPSNVKMDWLAD